LLYSYLAHGTATDYMFEVLKVPMSFTWEIYGDENASYEDCFKMFNPLGQHHFEEVGILLRGFLGLGLVCCVSCDRLNDSVCDVSEWLA
jgi:hypothetical protein